MKPEEREVLADVVENPDAWDAHQRAHFIAKYGQAVGTQIADKNLREKVARHKPAFEQRKQRGNYRNRTQRELDEKEKENVRQP